MSDFISTIIGGITSGTHSGGSGLGSFLGYINNPAVFYVIGVVIVCVAIVWIIIKAFRKHEQQYG